MAVRHVLEFQNLTNNRFSAIFFNVVYLNDIHNIACLRILHGIDIYSKGLLLKEGNIQMKCNLVLEIGVSL